MDWVFFTILATIIWGIANVVDKITLKKWVRSPEIIVIFMGSIGIITSLLIYFTIGFEPIPIEVLGITFLAGILYLVANFLYLKSAKEAEITRVVPLFHLAPILTLIFAAITLGEIFDEVTYLGIGLLVIGSVLISIKKNAGKFTIGRYLGFMFISIILYSVVWIMIKYALSFASFWSIFSYVRLGGIAIILLFYFRKREEFHKILDNSKATSVIGANEIINVFGVLIFTVAMETGFVTLVDALSSLQSLFVLILAVLISKFYPKLINEKIDKRTVMQKFVAIILMIVGSILII